MGTDRLTTPTGPTRLNLRVALGSLLTVIMVVFITGCGVRVGSPAEPIPTANQGETWRQEAAIAVGTVADASAAVAGKADTEAIFHSLSDIGAIYLEHLGGVWTPPPREENPTPTTPVPNFASLSETDAYLVVVDQTTVLAELAETVQGEESAALASMWLSIHAGSLALADALDLPCPQPCDSQQVSGFIEAVEASTISLLVAEHSPELIAIYDALGYTWEVLAARSSDNRDSQAQIARDYRRLAELLSNDLSGTSLDPREATYGLNSGDPHKTIQSLNDSSVEFWLGLYPSASAEERRVIKTTLWDAYSQSEANNLPITAWPGLSQNRNS